MLSRAEVRVVIEKVLRGAVIVVLAFLLWQSLRKQPETAQRQIDVRGFGGLSELSRLSTAPERIGVRLDSLPSPLERDWLRALAGAGSRITWSGDVPGLMIASQPLASPAGGMRARVAAPTGSTVVVGDDVGAMDTVRADNSGAAIVLPSATGELSARVNGSKASTFARDSLRIGRVLVIGSAGWESKFVIASLEEEGWKVDTFIRVAPDVAVTQGAIAAIDTSRYSAVVALDGAASPYAGRIVEYTRSGGGVVIAPAAASLDAFSALRSGSVGRASSETRVIQMSGSVNLTTLPLGPISSLKSDAIPLEKRGASIAIAARRVNAGRVLQIGYEDTWRWRMGGGANALRDHRTWWTGLLSSVAYAPRIPLTQTRAADDAPLVGLVEAVGPATSESRVANTSGRPAQWFVWMFALLAISLIVEIASRRLRGAR